MLESPALLKGLETPCERSELYDNFDIHHEMLMSENENEHENEDDSDFYDENVKSLEN